MEKRNPIDILNELPIMDSIVFIIALFLIGGILEECGILKVAAEGIIKLTSNNAYLISLAILFLAFIISTFLSAGPAAATLLPICQSLYHAIPFKLIYAALALGILAEAVCFRGRQPAVLFCSARQTALLNSMII